MTGDVAQKAAAGQVLGSSIEHQRSHVFQELLRWIKRPASTIRIAFFRWSVRRRVRRAFEYDLERFLQFSSSLSPWKTRENLAAKLTESYHNLEKGLALPNPRPGFGAAGVERTVRFLSEYRRRYGDDDPVVRAAVGSLSAYREWNLNRGLTGEDIPHASDIEATLSEVGHESGSGSGVRHCSRDAVNKAVSGVTLDFFLTRSSVRQFYSQDVGWEDIVFAVTAAQKAPAVCNRQFGRIYLVEDAAKRDAVLQLQAGANGFSENIPALAVITTTLRAYWGPGERNQAWTDGGLFAMSFLLGLHARGLGAVCLNWSKAEDEDRRMREELSIPEDEVIVMLVAFGHLLSKYQVAASPRLPLERVLHRI